MPCDPSGTFCLTFCPCSDHMTINIEAAVSDPNGWAAFGIGSSMIGSDIYIFWKNSTGGCVVSRRNTNAYTMPLLSDHQNSYVVKPNASIFSPSPGKLSCSIARPYSDIPALTNSSQFVWAIGGGVSNPDVQDATFSRHTKKGRLDPMNIFKRDIPGSNDVDLHKTSNSWSNIKNSKWLDHIERAILMIVLALII